MLADLFRGELILGHTPNGTGYVSDRVGEPRIRQIQVGVGSGPAEVHPPRLLDKYPGEGRRSRSG